MELAARSAQQPNSGLLTAGSLSFFFLNILLSLMIFNWVQFIVCNYALISLSVFKNSSMHVMVVSGAKVTESHLTGVGSFASKWDKTKLLMWIL